MLVACSRHADPMLLHVPSGVDSNSIRLCPAEDGHALAYSQTKQEEYHDRATYGSFSVPPITCRIVLL